MPTPKISLVIATYRSGEALDALVESLDRQSLPSAEWEAIFVDDGSPDDTFDRLTAFASTRPHFRVEQIENSGWPCRPRNTGMDLASGEYIGFMDHDDELFPDALRNAYAYAKAHGADALNGKEARTDDSGWSLDSLAKDMPQVLGRELPFGALTPTNPHKLYRLSFLREHGIRFREGGRVLWEDIFFNIDVLRHAEVISTLASTPYYHWRTTTGSGSTTFRRAKAEWWHWLTEVVRAIDDRLVDPKLAAERRALRDHQYRARLLESFNAYYPERSPEARKTIFEHARRLQLDHFPEEEDARLSVSNRLRAHLLRAGHPHAMDRLVRDDPFLVATATTTSQPRWADGALELEVESTWRTPSGDTPALRRSGSRVFKALPAEYHRVFEDGTLDVTDEVSRTTVEVGLRSASTSVAWLAPTDTEPWVSPDDSPRFGARGRALIDPRTAALGQPLARERWLISARCTMADHHAQPAAISPAAPAVRLSEHDGLYAASTSVEGHLVLDLAPKASSIAELLHPTGRTERVGKLVRIEVVVSEVEGTAALELPLQVRGAHFSRGAALRARLLGGHADHDNTWRTITATLTGADRTAWVEFDATDVGYLKLGLRHPEATGIYQLSPDGLLRAAHPRRTR